jgi:uncharacterized SAM-binding protein YcdF (DUF218 family)
MYFFFSKVLLFLISPIIWISVLLLIALFTKRPKLKKRSLLFAVLLLLIFSNQGLLELFARHWNIPRSSIDKNKVYSAVIVLGGFSGEDNRGNGFFNENSDRFIQGIRLKTEGRVSHILISGGNGSLGADAFTEGAWVQQELKEFKFPDSVVLIEKKSRNTLENAAFSKQLLEQAHLPPPYLLVTSTWHMRRSEYIFKKAGLDVIPYSCNYLAGNRTLSFTEFFFPDTHTLYIWDYYIKEFIGLMVTHIKYMF